VIVRSHKPPSSTADDSSTTGAGELSLYSDVDRDLQKAMYVALERLKMLRRFYTDPLESARIQAEITAIAHWITHLSAQRQHLIIESSQQGATLVKLVRRRLCASCRNTTNNSRHRRSNLQGRSQAEPAPSPIWETQLDFLLAGTRRVARELFAHDCASYNLGKFPRCLTLLMNSLLRLRRHLPPTRAGETKIEVEHFSDSCAECGRAIEPPRARCRER